MRKEGCCSHYQSIQCLRFSQGVSHQHKYHAKWPAVLTLRCDTQTAAVWRATGFTELPQATAVQVNHHYLSAHDTTRQHRGAAVQAFTQTTAQQHTSPYLPGTSPQVSQSMPQRVCSAQCKLGIEMCTVCS